MKGLEGASIAVLICFHNTRQKMQKKLIDYIKVVGNETNNLSFGKDEIEKIIEE